jgi:hypothetical protein
MRPRTYILLAIGLISSAYLVAFFLSAEVEELSNGQVITRHGAGCFMASLVVLHPVWLANPLLWIGVYFFAKKRWLLAGVLGLLATVVGLTVFSFPTVTPKGTSRLGMGYYFWVASMVFLAILSFMGRWMKNRHIIFKPSFLE